MEVLKRLAVPYAKVLTPECGSRLLSVFSLIHNVLEVAYTRYFSSLDHSQGGSQLFKNIAASGGILRLSE
jgi:hypothetical protein